MNWEAIGAIGELLGAGAVVVTLIYLSFQLRQNTKTIKVSSAQAVTEELQAMFSLLCSDQSLADIFVEAGNSTKLDGAKAVRYYTFSSNLLRVYENAFLQRRENVIEEAHWEGMTRMMIDYTKMTAFPEYWHNRKHWMSNDFQQYMESNIIYVDPEPGVNIPGIY